MPPHAYAEFKGCLRWSFPRLGAYAGASTEFLLDGHVPGKSWWICLRDSAYATKSRLLSRVPTHTYAECKISGQQPMQLHKEFPWIHNVGQSKKTMLILPGISWPLLLDPSASFCCKSTSVWRLSFSSSFTMVLNRQGSVIFVCFSVRNQFLLTESKGIMQITNYCWLTIRQPRSCPTWNA